MPDPEPLAELEAAYLAARDARDRLDVARARGLPPDARCWSATPRPPRPRSAGCSRPSMRRRPRTCPPTTRVPWARCEPGSRPPSGPTPSCRSHPRIERASCDDASAWAAAIEAGGTTLRERLEGCYGTLADDLEVDGERLARPQILARLATEPDAARRRRLFLGLEPLWRGIDGDGVAIAGPGAADRPSPYQALLGNRELAGPPATPPSPPTSGRSGWPRATSSGGPSPPSRRGGTR